MTRLRAFLYGLLDGLRAMSVLATVHYIRMLRISAYHSNINNPYLKIVRLPCSTDFHIRIVQRSPYRAVVAANIAKIYQPTSFPQVLLIL